MSLQDHIREWSQEPDEEKNLPDERADDQMVEGKPVELEIKFSDPSNIMQTAQEMISAVKAMNPDVEGEEKIECDLSLEEIEAQQAERRAILEATVGKMADIQSMATNREAREIAEEAWDNWDNEMS